MFPKRYSNNNIFILTFTFNNIIEKYVKDLKDRNETYSPSYQYSVMPIHKSDRNVDRFTAGD